MILKESLEAWIEELRAIESKDCGYCKYGTIHFDEKDSTYYCASCHRALIYDRWGFDTDGKHAITGTHIAPGCVTQKELIDNFCE